MHTSTKVKAHNILKQRYRIVPISRGGTGHEWGTGKTAEFMLILFPFRYRYKFYGDIYM